MASDRHNAGNIPASVEAQQQRIKARQQPDVQRRLAEEQNQQVQQRFKDIEDNMQKCSTTEGLPKEMIEFVQDAQKALNMESISAYLKHSLDSWKELPLNIAVTGKSGSGKSTFINTVRGLTAEHENAADIGTTEQTAELKSYPHPDNSNLLLWDLPGVGTPGFPRDTYLKDIDFERFDCYIIITSERFTENDLWLAQQVDSKEKKFYFIRNKVDQDIYSENYDHPNSFNEEQLIEKLRQNCQKHLKNAGLENAPVFIVSNHLKCKDKWEFPTAIEKITKDFPENKQEAILLSLNNLSAQTKDMVDSKKRYLANRIWKVSVLAAVGGMCPLPGVKLLIDNKLISNETTMYSKQFGLCDKTTEEDENKIMKSQHQAMTTLQFACSSSEYIAMRLTANAEKQMQCFIQAAKMTTNAFASYTVVSVTLEEILEEYADIAKQECRRMVKEAGNDFYKPS